MIFLRFLGHKITIEKPLLTIDNSCANLIGFLEKGDYTSK